MEGAREMTNAIWISKQQEHVQWGQAVQCCDDSLRVYEV